MERQELFRLIDQAADERWEKLDLGWQEITEIPDSIANLTNLTSLNLSVNQITEIPESIVNLTNLTSLDLRWNKITEIPDSIANLTNLTSLNLSVNQITEIPESIANLTNLTNLDLSNNKITEIPDSIVNLIHLTSLNLGFNQITEIPVAISNLTNLTILNLNFNRINEISAAIVNLTHLTELYFSNNIITEIPIAISNLTNLTNLLLNFNQITEIPTAIFNLTNLKNLYLDRNKITEIPTAIANLTNLNDLYLNDNKITKIPVEISSLTNLSRLDISINQITEIPAAISNLTNLTSLNLSNNKITKVPSTISNLASLNSLELSWNQITEIPAEISNLTNLFSLNLCGNQISKIPRWLQSFQGLGQLDLRCNPVPIPPEILGDEQYYQEPGDLQTILSFYFQTQDSNEKEPLYETKFIIVGEGEAGKTTLAKKLQDSNYKLDPDEDPTHGINIIRWDFVQPNGKPFRVNIWDFGGQEIYHATHQFFLTEHSLYTLLVDARRENPNLYYWLNIVRLLSDNSPVFIIKNEKHERQCEFNEGQLRGEFDNLQNSVRTNLATNRGLEDIKKAIETHIAALPHIHIPIPKTWVRIRNLLENYSQNQNYISEEEYYTLCQTNGLKDRQEMLIISKYLHDLGICLHFQKDPVLKHRVILNPTWATNAVYRVTDTDTVKANNGCFTRIDLETIWDDAQYAQMHDELLQLMQNFGICYPIRNLADTYIAPSLLSLSQPDYIWNETENLILCYKYEFMPRGILTRFIVEMHNLIESLPAPAPPTSQLVWKNGVILTDSRTRAEVIEYYEKKEIRIRVVGFQKKALLNCIHHEFKKIHKSYERLKYKELIPCNCLQCKDTQAPHTYTLERLYKRLENYKFTVECDESYESVDVRRLIDEVIEPMRKDNGLSSAQQARLEKDRDSLQSSWELMTDKLARLEQDLIIQTDTNTRFKLEKQIADEKARIADLTDRLNQIEDNLSN
jgi:Leucine-rich repeat (LRR) protein/GTPase SAR1 family protein